MQTINIAYLGYKPSAEFCAVSGQVGTLRVAVSFSREWAEYERKIAVFSTRAATVQIELDGNGEGSVPAALIASGTTLRVGVYGVHTDGNEIRRYNGDVLTIRVEQGTPRDADDATPDELTAFETMMLRTDAAIEQLSGAVLYTPQEKTEEEKAIARENLGITQGATDHGDLTGRDEPDQHPISAIEGLTEELAEKQDAISDLDEIRSGAEAGATAVQPAALTAYRTASAQDVIDGGKASADSVSEIAEKIPAQASAANQLADKNFVNSSIENVAAFYITKNAAGEPFATKAELTAATVFYSGGAVRVPTRNDYCVVLADESKTITETGENPTTRYIYDTVWSYQYIVNRSGLTAAQWESVNSGITAADVNLIGTSLQPSALDPYRTASAQDTIDNAKQPKTITDAAGYYTADTVEGALAEIGAAIAGINDLIGSGVIE